MNIEELRKSQSLEGQVAIVTGASRPNGQGRAISKALAVRGAELVMTDLEGDDPRYNYEGLGVGSGEMLADAVEEVRALGTDAVGVTADITDKAQIGRVVDAALEAFGGIDILVNNAGSVHGHFIAELTDDIWDASYRVNLKAPVDFAAAVLPHMRERGGGSIVQNTSVAGLVAFAGGGCYSGTKHGAVGMMKVMAEEFGPDNIRVNAVCPGNVWTDISQREAELFSERGFGDSAEQVIQTMKDMASLPGRYATPQDIAEAVAFLCTPGAKFITGITLRVDGGISIVGA
ncbi:MAG: SDR family oxidoreductase [Acidimicrobiaceae bacterium]|nr:SDR family oxidoreductase [Acidimicrobiaceae bacterium]